MEINLTLVIVLTSFYIRETHTIICIYPTLTSRATISGLKKISFPFLCYAFATVLTCGSANTYCCYWNMLE